MPVIMPIKNLKNTSEISELAHSNREPIFITKNGRSDLVIMSSELYDYFANVNQIDRAIYESEKEVEEGAKPLEARLVFSELEMKYFG